MEAKAKQYIDAYFAAYKNANDIKFLDEDFYEAKAQGQECVELLSPEQIVESVLNQPVLINKRSTYVDLYSSGVGVDHCSRYTYFDAGYTVLNHTKDDELVVIHPGVHKQLTSQMNHKYVEPPRFFELIHLFPQILIEGKNSVFETVGIRASHNNGKGTRVFSTSVPIIGNIDLFNLLIKDSIHTAGVSIEYVNRSLQNAAINPGSNIRCLLYSKFSVKLRFDDQISETDVDLIRSLQAQTLSAIAKIEGKLTEGNNYFKHTKLICSSNLVGLIISERQKKIDLETAAKNKKNNDNNYNKLLNNF